MLFAVEILYFILLPIWRELREWIRMKRAIFSSSRTMITIGGVVAALVLMATPWSSTVGIPAMLEPTGVAEIHVPVPARLVSIAVANGAIVTGGARLMTLESDQLLQERKLARLEANIVDLRLDRLTGDADDREAAIVLRQERAALQRKLNGIDRQIAELEIAAPIAGVVAGLLEHGEPGRWVLPSEALAVVHGRDTARVRGLLDASDSARVRPGMSARFVPDDPLVASIRATISHVSDANVSAIDQVALASSYGGEIQTVVERAGTAVPVTAQYRVEADILDDDRRSLGEAGTLRSGAPQSGVLLVQGDPQSTFARVWRRILMVLVRESGF